MQTVIGRLTADAKISELKDGRKVVNFSLASNRRFKPKGASEVKKITTFYNGSYWISTGIAEIMKKGSLLEVGGFIDMNTWSNMQGEAKGTLTIHASYIELHGKAKTGDPVNQEIQPVTAEAKDDLPF
jgi:single-strand DNA-binding protein